MTTIKDLVTAKLTECIIILHGVGNIDHATYLVRGLHRTIVSRVGFVRPTSF